MTVKRLPLNDLIRIAGAGGGFRISARAFSVNDLIRICGASGEHPSRIIIEDTGDLTVDDMIRIAGAGKGSAFFE